MAKSSNTQYVNALEISNPVTVPQHKRLTIALMMIRVLRSCRSTNVPPNTPHDCWAIIEAEPSHPAAMVECDTEYPISEIASERKATPIAVAVSAVNHSA